jgi:tagatose 1,6-diphosphate aldolase
MPDFVFKEYPDLTDGEIELVVQATHPGGEVKEGTRYVPDYDFSIRLTGNPEPIGHIALRIGSTKHLRMYGGHIGYRIEEPYRGHHYAAKACRLVKQVALDYGMKTVWITCNPDNLPSRKTCEAIGCKFVEIVDLPEHLIMYREGDRQKCRYRWDLSR